MRHFTLFGLAATLAVSLSAGEFKVGSKVSDFSLKTTSGETVQFASLKGPVTVVTFVATQCPVSNAYNERMVSLYKDYSDKGVKFVFINSNKQESAEEVAAHAQKNGFEFQVYKDHENVVADKFAASVTPETFVIDKNGTVVYHGSIDDSQELSRVSDKRVNAALDAVLAGKAVQTAQTKAFGCSIKRVKKTT
jgi:peroxiredoxin